MLQEILLVEDNSYKREKIVGFLETLPYEFHIDQAYSFASGSQKLQREYDLVILDVSLPTYDKDDHSSGGRFRSFGGRELARKIIRRSLSSKILFITQYEAFNDKETSLSFSELGSELENECANRFLGLIYYDSSKSAWKEEITKIFIKLKNENTNN